MVCHKSWARLIKQEKVKFHTEMVIPTRETDQSKKKHGFGTIIFAKDNNVYSGFWKDDKRHGKLAKILILRQRKDGFDQQDW